MANPCRKWEVKLEGAVKVNNTVNQLKFKEKLTECVAYTARLMIKEDEKAYREIANYGMEIAKKYNIPEIEYYLRIIENEAKAAKAKGTKASETKPEEGSES
ncbi:hypothetical protein [Caldivirga sp.]|uniref:hypothetical protein n=1 Tax=Caldivirga sp. TaxID=2080243 RepID=UPI0025C6AFEF|nr:hypothetical protein [Caldivirga sp.]